MGEKKSKNEGEKKQNDNDGGKKDGGSINIVLKVDMHCDGCAFKVRKCIQGFEGVETVKGDEKDSNKLTVTGKVDPLKLRERLEQKTKKKVELLSPLPKKDKNGGEGEKKAESKPEKKQDEKKSKQPAVTTAVFKVNTHCEGCIQKMHKIISKTKGYESMSVDRQKELVTVKGAIDMKALAETLKEKLKRSVEIVPAKKEGGGDKKEKGDGGGGGGGGEKAKKSGGEGKGKVAGDGVGESGGKVEQNRMEHVPYGYPYPYAVSEYAVPYPVHAPQIFSDENPNACSVM